MSSLLDGVSGAQLDLDNPWPGLDAYQESSHAFFSGRAPEVDELHRRIVDEPLTVLFGKSGLGKTSLLKAGVFPRLREKGLLPIFLRLQIRPGAQPPLEQVRLAIFHELQVQGVEHPDAREGETLWEYLHRTGQEFWTRQNRLVRPILVFDQFEEIFTLGREIPTVIAAFREDLSDLVENRIPASIARQLEPRSIGDLGVDAQAMPYKVVLSLREDFLADLEEWRVAMPSLRRNRMRLLPMGPQQAMQAVYNDRTRHLVAEPAARTIVDFLSSGPPIADQGAPSARDSSTVEPALLSLFCRGVNEHRKRDGKARLDDALIEGAKDTIVADFYRASLADQPDRVQRFIEEQLITESGFRNSYSVDDAIALGSLARNELDTLVDRHLLRHEHHLGADRVELTHDLLTAAVAAGRDERRVAERESRERLEQRKLRRVTEGFALAALIFLGLAIVAWNARRSAAEEGDRSRSKELAAIATAEVNQNPELAVILAREALNKADTAEARSALIEAAQYVWPQALLDRKELQGQPVAIALNRDGSRLAVVVEGHTVSVWNVSVRQPSLVWTKRDLDGTSSLAFSPDQRLLAVGRTTSIDMLEAESGRIDAHLTAVVNKHLGQAVADRWLSFSPDGAWLASTQSDDFIRLLDYRNDHPAPRVRAKGVVQFAVAEGGRHIVAVSTYPLAVHAMALRNGTWRPTEQDLSVCRQLQSISTGPISFSTTWKAGSCTFATDTLSRRSSQSTLEPADDIVWSPGGLASAEILLSKDIIVGQPGRPPFRIKGAQPTGASDKSRHVSVSETGKRIGLIDKDGRVQLYSLAEDKPLLSPFRSDAGAVSLHGSWIAARRAPSAGEPPAIDVIWLEGVEASHLPRRTRLVLDAVPSRLYAGPGAVIAVLQTEPASSVVLDVKTGRPRFPPVLGTAEPLGERHDLLLVRAGDAFQVVRVSDGASLAPWAPPAGVAVPSSVVVSPERQAILIVTEGIPREGKPRIDARAYVVRGDSLNFVGDIPGMPMDYSLAYAVAGITIADDGTTVTARSSRRWSMTSARRFVEDHTEVPTGGTSVELQRSPLGHFEIRPAGDSGLELRRRSSRFPLKRFSDTFGRRFSSDDRWLALWDQGRVEVFDLTQGRTWLTLNHHPRNVSFAAANTMLNVELADQESLLVPLTDQVIRQFADWLVPRRLSDRERCLYGFDEADCLQDSVRAPSPTAHADRR